MSAPGEEEGLDLDERELCPDGACVGVIGDDGRCKVCGATGAPPAQTAAATSPRDPGSGTPGLAITTPPRDPGSGTPGTAVASADDDAFDDDRELCPDGACIGVLGPDGKCKTCGRSAAS